MMTNQEILDYEFFCDSLAESITFRGYFEKLLQTLWFEGERFSGKRPFGDSGWEYDLYKPLVQLSVVSGTLDEDGYIEEVNKAEADKLISKLISEVFQGASK